MGLFVLSSFITSKEKVTAIRHVKRVVKDTTKVDSTIISTVDTAAVTTPSVEEVK